MSDNISLLPGLLYNVLCSIMHIFCDIMAAFITIKFDLGSLFNGYTIFRRFCGEVWMFLPQKHESRTAEVHPENVSSKLWWHPSVPHQHS